MHLLDVQGADLMKEETQETAATIEETIGTAALDADPDHQEVAVTADLMTVETTGVTLTAGTTETTDTTGIAMIEAADAATAHHRSAALPATVADRHQIRPNASAETAVKSNLKSTCQVNKMLPSAGRTPNRATAPLPMTITKEETELRRFVVN
jgi:hypothetical protein